MLKADLSNAAFDDCASAVKRALQQRGQRNQNSEIVYAHGEMILIRTNGDEIEARHQGKLVMKVFPVGVQRPHIWLPGDWLREVEALQEP